MDTPYTLRATHLKDLYETITMKTLAKDERLDILLTLKATVRVRKGEGRACVTKKIDKKHLLTPQPLLSFSLPVLSPGA